MRNSVLLKVNEKTKDAKILVAYLMTLPYVELMESEYDDDDMPEDVSLPFFSPETTDELKEHIADIEHKISNGAKLIGNEDVIDCSKRILKRYENQMV